MSDKKPTLTPSTGDKAGVSPREGVAPVAQPEQPTHEGSEPHTTPDVQTTSLCRCGGRVHDGVCGRCLRNEAATCPKTGDPCPMCGLSCLACECGFINHVSSVPRGKAGVPASPCLTCDCADQHSEGDDVPCEAERSKTTTCPKSGDPCPMCDANGRQACDEARDLPAVRELLASETVVDYDTFTDACETAHELGRLAGVEDERARIRQIIANMPTFNEHGPRMATPWKTDLLAKIDGGMTDA